MARRTPFPFRDHYDPAAFTHLPDGLIESLIDGYEDALLVEYKSGDMDVASFHEGLRTAREEALVMLLGIDQEVVNAYWLDGKQPRHPQPYPDELPLLSDPDNWLITYEQVEQWTGHRLDREQWDVLNGAIPNSSVIPEAIATIVSQILKDD
jgi:hypothetical protein